MYLRPGLGEAHGQQHVQSGPMFDGARPGLALPPRRHFGIQVLFSCHNSLLHRYLRSSAPLLYFHLFESNILKKKVEYLNHGEFCKAEARRKHQTVRGKEHFSGFDKCSELDQAAS